VLKKLAEIFWGRIMSRQEPAAVAGFAKNAKETDHGQRQQRNAQGSQETEEKQGRQEEVGWRAIKKI
jgi:hypothetical protein